MRRYLDLPLEQRLQAVRMARREYLRRFKDKDGAWTEMAYGPVSAQAAHRARIAQIAEAAYYPEDNEEAPKGVPVLFITNHDLPILEGLIDHIPLNKELP